MTCQQRCMIRSSTVIMMFEQPQAAPRLFASREDSNDDHTVIPTTLSSFANIGKGQVKTRPRPSGSVPVVIKPPAAVAFCGAQEEMSTTQVYAPSKPATFSCAVRNVQTSTIGEMVGHGRFNNQTDASISVQEITGSMFCVDDTPLEESSVKYRNFLSSMRRTLAPLAECALSWDLESIVKTATKYSHTPPVLNADRHEEQLETAVCGQVHDEVKSPRAGDASEVLCERTLADRDTLSSSDSGLEEPSSEKPVVVDTWQAGDTLSRLPLSHVPTSTHLSSCVTAPRTASLQPFGREGGGPSPLLPTSLEQPVVKVVNMSVPAMPPKSPHLNSGGASFSEELYQATDQSSKAALPAAISPAVVAAGGRASKRVSTPPVRQVLVTAGQLKSLSSEARQSAHAIGIESDVDISDTHD